MLDPLASEADLDDRGILVPDSMSSDAILASASDAVRDAAGCAISVTTSTVVLVVDDGCEFDLPGGPVSAVASVTVAGVPVVGWVKVGNTVRMPSRWTRTLPAEVTVTYTHGYPVIPADIVDLVCSMASMAFDAAGNYGTAARTNGIRLGDYSEQTNHPAGTESASPIAVPDAVRDRLRARFGTAAVLIAVR